MSCTSGLTATAEVSRSSILTRTRSSHLGEGPSMLRCRALTGLWALLAITVTPVHHQDPPPIKLLFLGDPRSHHKPAELFRQLQPILAKRGIDMTYVDKAEALDTKTLAPYDGLVLYSNMTRISPEQE